MRLQGMRTAWSTLRRPRVQDTTLVVVMVAFGVTAMVAALAQGYPVAASAAFFTIAAVPLIVRRSRPVPVAAVAVALDVVSVWIAKTPTPGIGAAIALYSLGRHAPGRNAWIFAAVAAPLYAVVAWGFRPPGNEVGSALGVVVTVGLGQFFRLRYELRERREQHRAETAVRSERRRIARELHDVVAHHISVINVLVGAGRTTMITDPEQAQEVLVTAERTARAAMAEMRQLLHVLRADDIEEPENHAGVGSEALPALISQAGSAGLPARLDVSGQVVPLPSTVDHAVYRIVQEALTNTRKHAGEARASVRLEYRPGAVEVEVLDDGLGPRSSGGGGYGLGGMAERVALCGGQLQTGPRAGGGFRVYAHIPVPALQKESQ
jgi:signal transduction histidine kinase